MKATSRGQAGIDADSGVDKKRADCDDVARGYTCRAVFYDSGSWPSRRCWYYGRLAGRLNYETTSWETFDTC
ncbi:hypothetical protein KSP35_14160 [Aquihabitans sp. G128]|uniref:hypothetical protein n=1 Tax=Aquihabitans sp. G128 TaxID=2849779 RepID=UPI001C2147B2|nr:hypothetical protein [Aquihabitans sp. G128]QXC59528.1 hypothetical protein KSP35_14160 [Aquihabitans sp. G128]